MSRDKGLMLIAEIKLTGKYILLSEIHFFYPLSIYNCKSGYRIHNIYGFDLYIRLDLVQNDDGPSRYNM